MKSLAILQENCIVNRDIKPENIILVEDIKNPGQFLYKISDFGVGYEMKMGEDFISTETLVGFTKDFAAPELTTLLEKKYNPYVADVYSLGVVILKMINCKLGKNEINKGLLTMKESFMGY